MAKGGGAGSLPGLATHGPGAAGKGGTRISGGPNKPGLTRQGFAGTVAAPAANRGGFVNRGGGGQSRSIGSGTPRPGRKL
jgi:hypothetical protein